MKTKVSVGISNNHLHLTLETFKKLFNKEELTLKKKLNQIGEFACEETVTIKCNDQTLENLRIIGPFRPYDQIEVSKSNARKLKINPPVRRSGDVKDSIPVTLIGPAGEVELEEGVIIANRHVHFNLEDAKKYNVTNGQKLYIKINNEKSGIIEAEAKVSSNGFYELHIDTDDANAFLLNNNDEVEIFDEI